ncbi:hypothetical protein Bca52824_030468 [Brassica carinata]|uniref:TIR domain-containing protein n=1 Tax=Brassica carinata TaxID=52824 RepID=A0A8X7V4F8_BRACI|nr:hypothetical protein Bca52824_030468 [Brassica carinata]
MGEKQQSPQYQVFLNFRGAQLRHNFIDHLVNAMKGRGINVFIDTDEQKGKDIKILFKRIEESRVALAIFSTKYTESSWCLDELATIKKRVDLGMLEFYYIVRCFPSSTRCLQKVLKNLWESLKSKIDEWKKALECVSGKIGLTLDEKSSERNFIGLIITNVLGLLEKVSSKEQTTKSQIKLKTTQPREGVGLGTGGKSSSYPTNVPSGKTSINPAWLGSGSSLSGGNSLSPNATVVSGFGSQSLQVPYSTMSHKAWTTGPSGFGSQQSLQPPMQGIYNMGQSAGSASATRNALAAETNQLISSGQRPQQPYSTVRSSLAPSGLQNNHNAQYGPGQITFSSSTSYNGIPISKHTYVWNPSPGTTMTPTSHFPPMDFGSFDYDSDSD